MLLFMNHGHASLTNWGLSFANFRDGMTMLVVTHEMEFARNVSNKVMFMEDGCVIESGPSGEFFAAPKEARSREFINTILNKDAQSE